MRSKHFVTELLTLRAGAAFAPEPEKCQLWVILEGDGTIGGETFRQGEVWLSPDTGEQPAIRAEGGARLLRTYVPR